MSLTPKRKFSKKNLNISLESCDIRDCPHCYLIRGDDPVLKMLAEKHKHVCSYETIGAVFFSIWKLKHLFANYF